MKKAFSLIELSIVILIIGILVAGVTQGSIIVAKSRVAAAAKLTESSPVPSIKDLVAWYETTTDASFKSNQASDNVDVDLWNDINPTSITKNNATQTPGAATPNYVEKSINNLPALRFNGTTDYMVSNDIASYYASPMTIFMVFRATFAPLQPEFKTPYSFHSNNTNRLIMAFQPNTDEFSINISGSPFNVNYASNIYNTDTIMTLKAYGRTAATADLYFNGGLTISRLAEPLVQNNTANQFSIGQEWDGSTATDFWPGDIGEIIIYSRALTNSERRDVEAYLGKKWGIKVN
jgi:prepilin-type N-terminal cleavage/methylation domain-containing protein